MTDSTTPISAFDPALWAAIEAEGRRQEGEIELIASENHASPRVMATTTSLATVPLLR